MSRRDDAPRDLFFALLALSTGQITSDQLVTAFGQWNRSPGSRLADILVTQGAIDEETRKLLTELATRQLRKHGGDAEPLLESLAISRPVREKLAEAAPGILSPRTYVRTLAGPQQRSGHPSPARPVASMPPCYRFGRRRGD